MDPLTHTLVGVGIANAFYREKLGPRAVPLLALAANLPDIDVAVHLSGQASAVLLRRGFGHSLLLAPLWCAGFAFLMSRWRWRDKGFGELFVPSLAGVASHLLFYLINSFGVQLLWPVWPLRPELAVNFIIDLALTGFLAFPLLAAAPKFLREGLRGFSRAGLALAAGYLLFCWGNRARATRLLDWEAKTSGLESEFSYVFPEPFGPHRWKGVLRTGSVYHLYLIHSVSGKIEPRGEEETASGPEVEAARKTALALRLERFFKAPVWSARKEAGGSAEVSVRDLRFQSLLLSRGHPFEFRFRVRPDGAADPL